MIMIMDELVKGMSAYGDEKSKDWAMGHFNF